MLLCLILYGSSGILLWMIMKRGMWNKAVRGLLGDYQKVIEIIYKTALLIIVDQAQQVYSLLFN